MGTCVTVVLPLYGAEGEYPCGAAADGRTIPELADLISILDATPQARPNPQPRATSSVPGTGTTVSE